MRAIIFLLSGLLLLCPIAASAQDRVTPHAASEEERLYTLIELLNDDALRQRLTREVERIRQETPTEGPIKRKTPKVTAEDAQPAEENEAPEVFSDGLMTALSQWLSDLGERLPTAALGAPIDVKIAEAESQVTRRLSTPGAVGDLQQFGWRSALGWAAMTGLALLVAVFIRRRRGLSKIARQAGRRAVWREVMVRTTHAFAPLGVCLVVALAWLWLFSYSSTAAGAFITSAVPFAGALVVSGIVSAFLVLLANSKGWRLVAYAQRRLSPMVGILVGIAMASSIVITPEMRRIIGPAASDIASLMFDIAVPVFAIVIIAMHRRTIRSLIVRGHSPDGDRSLLDRAIVWTGAHWHYFGFAFAFLNIGARLFGTKSGDFLTQSSLSVSVIVIAFIVVASIDQFETSRNERAARRRNASVRTEVLRRLATMLYRGLQIVAVIFATILCLGFWGIDVAGWLGSAAGVAVVGPLISIVMVVLVAWTLWVALDAWIAAVLSVSAAGGGMRERSARARTLLPLLRNVAFVILSVLTAIGVLANLGINVAPLIAGAGVVGLAVGFGSQQLVQDVITGLFILLEDTLAIGDVIDTGDRSGTVEALTIRTVKIRDGDGALHTIPFSTVKALKNSSRGFGVYTVSITLEQGADIEEALRIMKTVGEEVHRDARYSGIILGPLDVWGVDQVGPDGVVLKGSIRTRPLRQHGVGREINRLLNARLREKGILLASRNAASERRTDAASA